MAEKPKAKKEKEGGRATFRQEEEKILVIPLRKMASRSPRNYRMKRSVREIKAFLARHAKTKPSNIFVSQQLNEKLWKGGIHSYPPKIKVKVAESEGKFYARLMDEKEKPKKQQQKRLGLRERLTRRRETAKEEKPEPKEEKAEPAKEAKPEPAKEKPKAEPKEINEEGLLEKSR